MNTSRQPASHENSNDASLPEATQADLDLVRNLCQIVVRQFYGDQHAIVMDLLSRYLL